MALRRNEEIVLNFHRLFRCRRRQSRSSTLHHKCVDRQLQFHHRHVDTEAGCVHCQHNSQKGTPQVSDALTPRASPERRKSVYHPWRGIEPAVRIEPVRRQFDPTPESPGRGLTSRVHERW